MHFGASRSCASARGGARLSFTQRPHVRFYTQDLRSCAAFILWVRFKVYPGDSVLLLQFAPLFVGFFVTVWAW